MKRILSIGLCLAILTIGAAVVCTAGIGGPHQTKSGSWCGNTRYRCKKCGNVGCSSYDCPGSMVTSQNRCKQCGASQTDWEYFKP